MEKQIIKQISKDEKIEFYKKYTNKEFQRNLEKAQERHHKIGLLAIKVFFIIGIVGMFISPWAAFAYLPGFIVPLITIHLSNLKQKKAVESLSENISYEDFMQMVESGEWQQLAHELAEKAKTTNSFVEATQEISLENSNKCDIIHRENNVNNDLEV